MPARDVRCVQCGPAEYRTPGILCDSCFEIACDQIEADRVKFQKLLSAGVDRKMANRIMTNMINGGPPC